MKLSVEAKSNIVVTCKLVFVFVLRMLILARSKMASEDEAKLAVTIALS